MSEREMGAIDFRAELLFVEQKDLTARSVRRGRR
jgi:hypothetical protein